MLKVMQYFDKLGMSHFMARLVGDISNNAR